jgi:hypothetical protein
MIQAFGDNLIPAMAIGCTFLFFVIWIVMATIDSIHKTKCTTRLKEQLIQQGSSASEIDQIIRAGTSDEESPYIAPVPPVKTTAYPMSG